MKFQAIVNMGSRYAVIHNRDKVSRYIGLFRETDFPPYVGWCGSQKSMVETTFYELLKENVDYHFVWVGLNDLLSGDNWLYMTRAIEHFNLERPLTGQFHSHVTIDLTTMEEIERCAQMTRGRVVMVEIERDGRVQVDPVLTYYYQTGARGLRDESDVRAMLNGTVKQIQSAGFKVSRVKLEHEPFLESSNLFELVTSVSRAVYVELHCVVRAKESSKRALVSAIEEIGWRWSKNTKEDISGELHEKGPRQFITKRLYGVDVKAVSKSFDELALLIHQMSDVHMEAFHRETVLFDTNQALDSWWTE